jgi:hypothetical protein
VKAVKAKERCRSAEDECRVGVIQNFWGRKSDPCTVVLERSNQILEQKNH